MSYPGRGVAVGLSDDGRKAVLIYFIMGRSANSRNRIFVTDGEGIRTQAFDESAMKDPSLIIYAPVRVANTTTIVTNGDQTDTIYDELIKGGTFEGALTSKEERFRTVSRYSNPHMATRIPAKGSFTNMTARLPERDI